MAQCHEGLAPETEMRGDGAALLEVRREALDKIAGDGVAEVGP